MDDLNAWRQEELDEEDAENLDLVDLIDDDKDI
jgi:hypothetical protein